MLRRRGKPPFNCVRNMITERQPVRPFEQRIPLKLFLYGFLAILVSLTIDELQAQSIPEAERAALISLCERIIGLAPRELQILLKLSFLQSLIKMRREPIPHRGGAKLINVKKANASIMCQFLLVKSSSRKLRSTRSALTIDNMNIFTA